MAIAVPVGTPNPGLPTNLSRDMYVVFYLEPLLLIISKVDEYIYHLIWADWNVSMREKYKTWLKMINQCQYETLYTLTTIDHYY